jgi:hypothetical protein
MACRIAIAGLLAGLICVVPAAGEQAEDPTALRLEVDAREATVGDQLATTITLDLAVGSQPELPVIGPRLGEFEVLDGAWSGPVPSEVGERWSWSGKLAVFQTGSLEIPPISVRVGTGDGAREVTSDPVSVEIRSLLDADVAAQEETELADIKPPASMPGDYRALWAALGLLALLLAGAALLWWLQRRYASRLAAAEVPEDPFHRVPPHVWVYQELQRLLERRLEERGESELFHAEVSRIIKQYLGGRYRVDLMEQTSSEVPVLLRQAGAPATSIDGVNELLSRCDLVKFARNRPRPELWREVVEMAYGVVDATKPEEAANNGTERGAA